MRLGYNRSNLVAATALTYLGLSAPQALAQLRALRPGWSLPARLRIETA